MANTENRSARTVLPVDRMGLGSWEEFLEELTSFHGYRAPGVIAGGVMVSLAREQIPEGVLFNAICETPHCLPDSVQLLTPCTIGNGWLKVINLGRFAVSLYDKFSGYGVRTYLDAKKLHGWHEIQSWFLKTKPKRQQDGDRLLEQIWQAGRDIYTLHPVRVASRHLTKRSKGSIDICAECGQAYPVKDGAICLGCQGEAPYEDRFLHDLIGT